MLHEDWEPLFDGSLLWFFLEFEIQYFEPESETHWLRGNRVHPSANKKTTTNYKKSSKKTQPPKEKNKPPPEYHMKESPTSTTIP